MGTSTARLAGLATLLIVAAGGGYLAGRANAPARTGPRVAPSPPVPRDAVPREGAAPIPTPSASVPGESRGPAPVGEAPAMPSASARAGLSRSELLALYGVELPERPSEKELRSAAGRLGASFPAEKDPRLALQADLLERILREFPAGGDQGFADLHSYLQLCLQRREFERADRGLAEFGTRIGLARWREAEFRASLASSQARYGEAREHFTRISTDSDAPEYARVNGMFWVAYYTAQEGDPALAKSKFREILDRWGDTKDPTLRGSVDGARAQLELLEKAGK